MTTVAENMHEMAALVSSIKTKHRLSEQTVLRVMDMTLALAQSQSQYTMPEGVDIIEPEEETPDNVIPFPTAEEETND